MLLVFYNPIRHISLIPPIQASELEDEAQAQVARIGSEAHEARRERDDALKALHAAELVATRHENEVNTGLDALI
jgi:hypothetical protein